KNDDEYELEVLYGSATSDVDDVGYLKFDINGSLKAFGYASVATTGGDTVYTLEQNMYVANEPPRMSLFITPETALDPRAAIGNIGDTGMAAMNGTDAIRGVVSLDFTEFTQFDGERITAKILYRNGNAPGSLEDYSIGGDGKITGRYSNGETRLLGQIPVAKFRNPAGLEKVGSNLYVETANSGQFDGTGDTGDIMGGALEMSNVDLSQEFTEMITTQRGFQANSRVITVSDDMLAELVNLKR
ncbi:MAG: flagellar hook-basal body complex protein, partial [Defluviitaleaceae bacterium]|nr:flagellar hook-basal body complex protein [Defluviitaleaceae bacterium]